MQALSDRAVGGVWKAYATVKWVLRRVWRRVAACEGTSVGPSEKGRELGFIKGAEGPGSESNRLLRQNGDSVQNKFSFTLTLALTLTACRLR